MIDKIIKAANVRRWWNWELLCSIRTHVEDPDVTTEGCVIISPVTWGTTQGHIKSATLPVNPYGVVHRREEATRRLLLGKPNLFRSGQKGGESETRKLFFSGWAPNGDATGDLWTTCRCYGPINSRCRRQQRRRPASHSRSLSPVSSSSHPDRSCSDT